MLFKKIVAAITLPDLVIVVAITGILGSVSVNGYHDYSLRRGILAADSDEQIRNKVIQGLVLAEAAKVTVEEGFQSGGMRGLDLAASAWNNDFESSGATYVSSIWISSSASTHEPGAIEIEFNTTSSGIPELVANRFITLTPHVSTNPLTNNSLGAIDWACTGAGTTITVARNLKFKVPTGAGVLQRYSPQECQ